MSPALALLEDHRPTTSGVSAYLSGATFARTKPIWIGTQINPYDISVTTQFAISQATPIRQLSLEEQNLFRKALLGSVSIVAEIAAVDIQDDD